MSKNKLADRGKQSADQKIGHKCKQITILTLSETTPEKAMMKRGYDLIYIYIYIHV